VAHAGFSGSLLRQAQPHLQQAIQQIKLDLAAKSPARNSAEAGFQTQFVDAINNQAQEILGQIETAVNGAQAIAQSVVSSFHSAVSQLQAMGASIVENGQQILGNLFSNIFGSIFGGNGRALPPALSAIVHQVATNPEFLALVHASDSYKCLQREGLTVTFEYLQGLSAAGQLNAGLLEVPAIAKCVEEAGGLHAIIAGSEVVNWAQNLAAQLGLGGMIHQVIIGVVGEELGYLIIDALGSGRGFFGDAWNSISGVASSAWASLSQGVVSVGQYIANVATQVYQSAAEKFEVIKQLAMAFIQGGITTAQLATQQAAQEFLDFIAPYQADLGNLYTQVVSQITSIWDGIQLPSWQSRSVRV
jgi:phage-related protein